MTALSPMTIAMMVVVTIAAVTTLIAIYMNVQLWAQLKQAKQLQAQMEKDHADLVKRVIAADPANRRNQ